MNTFYVYILRAYRELQPCGVRVIVESLGEDHQDVKEASERALKDGYLRIQYKQYHLTEKGNEYLAGLDATPAPEPEPEKPQPATIPLRPKTHAQPKSNPVPPAEPEPEPNLLDMSTDHLIEIVKRADTAKKIILERLRDAGITL